MDFVKLTIETKRAERGEGAVLSSSADRFLSVMTYNIRHGRGRDGRVDLDRICAVIQEGRPDLIALQEVDRGMTRSGRIDQGARIADRLEMHWAPGHNGTLEGGVFGNVLLSRWPLTPLENIDLTVPGREPRGALLTEIGHEEGALLAGTLHFGLGMTERKRQRMALLGQLRSLYPDEPILLLGDFNSLPFSRTSRQFRRTFTDAFRAVGKGGRATFRRGVLSLCIDYIYSSRHFLPGAASVLRTQKSSVASDHFPLMAQFLWKKENENRNDLEPGNELFPDFPDSTD